MKTVFKKKVQYQAGIARMGRFTNDMAAGKGVNSTAPYGWKGDLCRMKPAGEDRLL
jgi:hypothetical protein